MTAGDAGVPRWAWDASALHHAAAADRIDVLFDVVGGVPQTPAQHVTTAAVAEELQRNQLWTACARSYTLTR